MYSKRHLKRLVNKKLNNLYKKQNNNTQNENDVESVNEIESDAGSKEVFEEVESSTGSKEVIEDFCLPTEQLSKQLAIWAIENRIKRAACNSLLANSNSQNLNVPISKNNNTSRNTSSWQKNMEQRIRKLEEISAQNTILLERIIDILQPKKIELMIFPIKNMNDLASTESLLLNKPEAEIVSMIKYI
uniref:Uncharacterized protein n=1 Tax=Bactrocera dorsalis TaxID=27457 RepID=A0A034VXX2_BACDO